MSNLNHCGVDYRRLMARVTEEAKLEVEDHGMVRVTLSFEHETGHQAIAPCFGRKHRNNLASALHLYLFLQQFKKGWTGYVLQQEGLIRGLQYLELDGGAIVMLDDIVKECEAMPE